MTLSTMSRCHHYLDRVPRLFITPRQTPCPSAATPHLPPHTPVLATSCLPSICGLICSWNFIGMGSYNQCPLASGFFHLAPRFQVRRCGSRTNAPFLFGAGLYSTAWTYHISFTHHLPVSSCAASTFWTAVGNAPMSWGAARMLWI
jgi:hypothetical protein